MAGFEQSSDFVLSVAIIEDVRRLRQGLATLINDSPGFRCAGAYQSMEDALAWIERDSPSVVLVDLGLPGMSGAEGIRILKERYPRMEFLVLTVFEDNQRIFEALCAGASGYLLKQIEPARLLEAIQEAANGGSPMSPDIARRVVRLFREVKPLPPIEHDLTPHELRILKLLVEGHSYKTAGAELGISYNTVCFHMKNIYAKLRVHSKSEAVAKALHGRFFK
jgi:DNA-binding NarL/FixJ family response regulator